MSDDLPDRLKPCPTCNRPAGLASVVPMEGGGFAPCHDLCHAEAWETFYVIDDSIEGMTEKVRRICARELKAMDQMRSMDEDDFDKLAKIALIMQRIRAPKANEADPNAGAEALTNEQLMKRSA